MITEELCPHCSSKSWFWLDHEEAALCTACKGRGIIYRDMEAEAELQNIEELVDKLWPDIKSGMEYLRDK